MKKISMHIAFACVLFLYGICSTLALCRGDDVSFMQGAIITHEDHRLEGHDIKSLNSPSLITCGQLCLKNYQCVSTNFILSLGKEQGSCEINSAGISNPNSKGKLKTEDGVVFSQYAATKEDNRFCLDAKDYAFEFPSSGITDAVVVRILDMPTLESFTLCVWMWSRDTVNRGTLFSYAIKNEDNELRLYNYQDFMLTVGGMYSDQFSVSANDEKWHHICASWENNAGSWKIYKDGVVAMQGNNFNPGHVISGGGVIVLGQDQGSTLGAGFEEHQSFVGRMTNVNLWDYVLPDHKITEMSKSCLSGEGNVLKWDQFKAGVQGGVRVLVPSPCQQ